MKTKLFGLMAAATLGATLLTACPSGQSEQTASPEPAASAAEAGAASPAAGTAVDAKAIFASKCAACHGANGGGGVGPNLANVEAKGDAHIKDLIVNGSPAKGMPAFGKQGMLTDAEIDALVSYVKTL